MKKIMIAALMVTSFLQQSCMVFGDKNKLTLESKDLEKKVLDAALASVDVANDVITISGSGFSDVTEVYIKGNGVDAALQVISKSNNQVIAKTTNALSLLVDGTFSLLISTANAQATYPVTFSLQSMGAASGQVLKYNGSSWVPGDLSSSQTYLGSWNAATQMPTIEAHPSTGDYYIVNASGTYTGQTPNIALDLGDWLMYNGTEWEKIPSGLGSKLSLTGGTLTGDLVLDTLLKFKGGSKHVTLKASSSLANDITLTLPLNAGTNGQVLTTNGSGVLSWETPAVSTAPTGNFITDLTGDVTASGPGSVAASVAQVGGVSAANVASGVGLANNSTNANTASTIVKRDSSGNFSAGTITATLNGNATNVTGTVAVANGGTGGTALTLNELLFGNGTSAVGTVAKTSTPSVLLSTTVTGAPTWTTSTAGNVLKGSVTGVQFGALALSDLPAGTLSGAGTINHIPYYDTTTTLANSPITVSGSNVGFGVSSPIASLHAAGAILSGTTTPTTLTTTTGTHSATDTTINVVSTADYPSSGLLYLTNGSYAEAMSYTGITATSFTGVTRGLFATTAMTLATGSTVDTVTLVAPSGSLTSAPAVFIASKRGMGIGAVPPAWLGVQGLYTKNSLSAGGTFIVASTIGFGTSSVKIMSTAASTTSDNWRVITNSVERFKIDGTGKTGIGNMSPRGYLEVSSYAGMNLSSTINSTATTLTVGANNFPASGTLIIDDEQMTYTGGGTTTLTVTRGANSTTAAIHYSASPISYYGGSGLIVSSSGVGIGTSAPSQALHVIGNILATGTITGSSDRRLKKNITLIDGALEKLEAIKGVKYFWKDPSAHNHGEQIGVIAQDVEKVFPQAVLEDDNGMKSVSYMALIAPVIEAVKELSGRVQRTNSHRDQLIEQIKLDNLRKDQEISELKKRLSKIEELLSQKNH